MAENNVNFKPYVSPCVTLQHITGQDVITSSPTKDPNAFDNAGGDIVWGD